MMMMMMMMMRVIIPSLIGLYLYSMAVQFWDWIWVY